MATNGAPDRWDEGEEEISNRLSKQLNVDAPMFVPNVNAAVFVPSFMQQPQPPAPTAGVDPTLAQQQLVASKFWNLVMVAVRRVLSPKVFTNHIAVGPVPPYQT